MEELWLLRDKCGQDNTTDAKNKMWGENTEKANTLGLNYRKVSTVKTTHEPDNRYKRIVLSMRKTRKKKERTSTKTSQFGRKEWYNYI